MAPNAGERIARMQADGVVTPSQAAMLRDSLGARLSSATPDGGPRRQWLAWAIAAAGLVAVVTALAMVVASGPDGAAVQDVATSLNQPGGHGQMNKTLSAALVVVVLLVVPLLAWAWLHNALVSKEERVFEAWAQTESTFQRRADLIPALVDTVSRYLKHESDTLIGVTKQRAAVAERLAGAVDDLLQADKRSADILGQQGRKVIETDAAMAALHQAQTSVGRTMQTLLAVAEDYPELRSADQFLELQAQIEGTENRINVARMRFNQTVRAYNGAIRKFPGSLVAGAGNFRRKGYFRSDVEARDAVELDFD